MVSYTRNADSTYEELRPKGLRPVHVWSALGAGFLLLNIYVMGRWFLSGPTPTPSGETPLPGWMSVTIQTFNILSWVIGAVTVWIFLIRPWIRDRKISIDGMLILVFPFVWWQDMLANYTTSQVSYNSAAFNFGSWYGFIPGWLSPSDNRMAEPLWVIPAYWYWFVGSTAIAVAAMQWARRKWPNVSNVRLVLTCYLVMVLFDAVVETIWLRMGMYSYMSGIDWLTLFHGHYYQFPIYEVILLAASMCAIACVRFFRDDRGCTIAERGVYEVTKKRSGRFILRFLALVGIMNLAYFGYNLAFQWTGIQATDTVRDIQERSYFTNGVCGAGSGKPEIACPANDVPIPRPDSPRMRVDGTFTAPGE